MDKRIVIFADNIKRRESLEMLIDLSDDMICVGSFPDCSNVLNNIDKSEPDLVLMDIDMPNVNGIEGVTIIRTKYPNLKILMQTVFEDDEKLFACIRAGADGYILKKTQPLELLDAINEALEGGAPMTSSIARQVLRFVGSTENKQKSEDFKLTARETEILSLLVQGLSYKMIASRCFVSLPTVNSHVQHIYEKLQVNTAVEAVTKAIGNKIV
ncbi:MAG: response regulator transcription factor [Saprospiraceae bacterium]|nr:response regulator transcription factor [Saprospiraceae bacterium]